MSDKRGDSMLVSASKKFMRKSFENTVYRFAEPPLANFSGDFGIYVHVPFCYSKCSFCPFYKEIYSENLKKRYVESVIKEMEDKDIRGQARWTYFGGGTPNTLTLGELETILEKMRSKVELKEVGIELLPALTSPEYISGLKSIGFTKISIGVESFSNRVMRKIGRKAPANCKVEELIEQAMALGLWVNADMMVGLRIAELGPSQVTIYPFMVIRGVKAKPGMLDQEQFELIEEAGQILKGWGYERKSVWTFALGDEVYDSSRDELVQDYAGFGPAAFSTYGTWKVVNPELEAYLKSIDNDKNMAFIAPKTEATNQWREFARMIYDLKCETYENAPAYINAFIRVLRLTGYCRDGHLTPKGMKFAHAITKAVVESLPFPLQNPQCVENYGEYERYKKGEVGT